MDEGKFKALEHIKEKIFFPMILTLRGYARRIAEEIALLIPDYQVAIYYYPYLDDIVFTTPFPEGEFSGELITEKKILIGFIRGLDEIPPEWGIIRCEKCHRYHEYNPETGEINHESEAFYKLVDILENDIQKKEIDTWIEFEKELW